jgi:hypothetical protein
LYGMYYVTGDTLIIESVVPYHCYEWRYAYAYISPSGDSLFFLGGGFGRYPSRNEHAYVGPRYAYVRKQVPLWNYDWRRHTKAKYLRLPWREREARRIARAQRRQARRSK